VFNLSDKVRIGMAIGAAVLILPGMVPNALGIYSLEYDIAIWAPHILLFIVFGPATIWQLLRLSQRAASNAADAQGKMQERALTKVSYCLLVSFVCFVLTLALAPFTPKSSVFMIFKTFAYMTAFYFLIKGFLAPAARNKFS
jgi:hypothetical protein